MSSFISLSQAQDMVKLYRQMKGTVLKDNYKDILSVCETFDRVTFDSILARPDCQKIRIYYGMSSDYKMHAIIVGVNSQDEDILPDITASSGPSPDGDGDDSGIGEDSTHCPPFCPPASGLYP